MDYYIKNLERFGKMTRYYIQLAIDEVRNGNFALAARFLMDATDNAYKMDIERILIEQNAPNKPIKEIIKPMFDRFFNDIAKQEKIEL